MRHDVDAHHAAGATLLHLQRKNSGITANVQHGFALQSLWNKRIQDAPAAGRVIGCRGMTGGSRGKYDVVIPGSEPANDFRHFRTGAGLATDQTVTQTPDASPEIA